MAKRDLDFSHYQARLAERAKRMAEWEHEPDADEYALGGLCERIDAGEMWRNVETEREAQRAADAYLAAERRSNLREWAQKIVGGSAPDIAYADLTTDHHNHSCRCDGCCSKTTARKAADEAWRTLTDAALDEPNAGELWLRGIQAIEAETRAESNETP
jgi:hypothetical protein